MSLPLKAVPLFFTQITQELKKLKLPNFIIVEIYAQSYLKLCRKLNLTTRICGRSTLNPTNNGAINSKAYYVKFLN